MNHDSRETMSKAEFRRIRQKLGLSLDEFAIELGYEGSRRTNNNTIRSYEDGRKPIPLRIAKLAYMFDIHGLPDSWPPELEAKLSEVPDEDVNR